MKFSLDKKKEVLLEGESLKSPNNQHIDERSSMNILEEPYLKAVRFVIYCIMDETMQNKKTIVFMPLLHKVIERLNRDFSPPLEDNSATIDQLAGYILEEGMFTIYDEMQEEVRHFKKA